MRPDRKAVWRRRTAIRVLNLAAGTSDACARWQQSPYNLSTGEDHARYR